MDKKQLLMIAAVCGGVVFLGVLLPWAKVSGSGAVAAYVKSSASISGTHAKFDLGIVILLLGLVGGAAAAMVGLGMTDIVKIAPKQQVLIAGGCLALALLLTIINFFNSVFKTVDTPMGSVGTSRGIGLYLTLLAGIAGTACVALVLKEMGVIGGGGSATSSSSSDAEGGEDA